MSRLEKLFLINTIFCIVFLTLVETPQQFFFMAASIAVFAGGFIISGNSKC